ncbi:hypothetical protein [uncultured Selenomonas sp.]|uniref:hypothetical protein n=1 Tax=uncultured Selenomonas sp. TaxID=159275 RepID=UPI0025E5D45C|nr:hypothetical protein [uncultured Selenomonas sp.]
MRIFLALIAFIIVLVLFLWGQHCYFSPRSLSDLAEERKRLKDAARRHIQDAAEQRLGNGKCE